MAIVSWIAAIVVIASATVPASADIVNYTDCGTSQGKIITVDITPCPAFPCQLKRGTTVTMNITFVAKEVSKTAVGKLYGIIRGVPTPYPLPEPDGCKCGVQCPTITGKQYIYKTAMVVPKDVAPIKLVVKDTLLDDNKKYFFCWEVPAAVV